MRRYYNDSIYSKTTTADLRAAVSRHEADILENREFEKSASFQFDSKWSYDTWVANDRMTVERVEIGKRELEKRDAAPGEWERKQISDAKIKASCGW